MNQKIKFKSALFLVFAFVITVMVVSCSSATEDSGDPTTPSGTTIVGNTTAYLVTFSAVTDAKSTVNIPLIVFGESSDELNNYSITATINNGAATTFTDLQYYFSSTLQAVRLIR